MDNSQVRIQLIGDVKGYLNIEKDVAFPLTFSIADIRDISKKKGTFSKSIILSGDKNNNLLLNNYFDVNIVEGTFDINNIQYCNVIENGIPILENALIQLVSINKDQQNSNYEDKITYTVLIKDATSNFFSTINNKFLTDLDFTYLNHVYTAENVINSFSNTVEDSYRYIMPYNPSITDDNQFDLTEFSPGIFTKTYFDKIFSTAGFKYNWIGMTASDTQFDKLIIPYVGDVITLEKSEEPDYIVKASKTTTQTYPNGYRAAPIDGITNTIASNQFTFPLNNNIIEENPLGLYVSTGGIYRYNTPDIPSFTNDVKYEVEIEYEITVENTSTGLVYLQGFSSGRISDDRLKIQPQLYSIRNSVVENTFNIIQQGNPFYSFTPAATSFPVGTTVLLAGTSNITGYSNGVLSTENAIYLGIKNNIVVSGVAYKFYTSIGSSSPTQQATLNLKIKNTKVKFSTLVSGQYGYNSTLNMNLFVPQKIKQSDFIKSIFTMYNIYCEVDKDNLTQLNLISRDEYYDNGKIVDWTKKLDKSRNQEIKFLPELQNKKLLLTYKQDKDVANEAYFKSATEVYGQLEFTFDNEYVKDTTKQEIIFSPTPMTNTIFGAVCPMWSGGYPNLNIRILYAGGIYSCQNYIIKNFSNDVGVTSAIYPFNSHWDRPINPTFDINFGVCKYYFTTYNYGAKTNNNLFNLHWRRTLEQINNGKMLTAYFNLNEVDISEMKLSDKIRIDNSWWNINSITDYDANSKSTTKVELISIDEGLFIPYQEIDVVTVEDTSTLVSLPRNRMARLNIEQKNINLSTTDIPINGINNIIGSQFRSGSIDGSNNTVVSNSTIIGDNNFIVESSFVIGSNNSASASTIIFGNSNNVDSSVVNSFVVGSGIIATQSDTLYSNNIIVSDGGTINNVPIEDVTGLWEKYDDETVSLGTDFKAIKLTTTSFTSITTPQQGMIIYGDGLLKLYDGSQWLEFVGLPINVSGSGAMLFDYPLIYNSATSPLTGNLTQAPPSPFMLGKQGIIQKIYHQQGTVPLFPAGWVLKNGSYSTTLLNEIYAEYCSPTRVEYWIISY